ncbi:hypothetical protein [Streptomyces sp. NPDC058335]|uniref:hypothetical protein n=1 Tax=Streptomyces sp. NPDC058335 TaxID=3346451 RepID=UPI00365F38A3
MDYDAPPAPCGRAARTCRVNGAALPQWFDDTSRKPAEALDADPGRPAWTFHPPLTVCFRQRRR